MDHERNAGCEVLRVDFAERPTHAAPYDLVIAELDGNGAAGLRGREREDLGHVLARRRTAGPSAAKLAVRGHLLDDYAQHAVCRWIDGGLHGAGAGGLKCYSERLDGTRDDYVVLHAEVVLDGGVRAKAYHRHLARAERELIAAEMRLKAGIAELNAAEAKWRLIGREHGQLERGDILCGVDDDIYRAARGDSAEAVRLHVAGNGTEGMN